MEEGNELESQDSFKKTQRKKVTPCVADPGVLDLDPGKN